MTFMAGGFEAFGLNKQTLEGIAEAGFTDPTPVQQKVIPLAIAGHDVLGIAPTGTGKTAAYLLPLIMKLRFPQEDPPRALILLPTRELAIQVGNECKRISQFTGLRILTAYGGTGIKGQMDQLAGGIDIIVATPGRFLDIYRTGELNTKKIRTLVLDEADRMLDMGFMPQIRSMLEILPVKKRQQLLFSATFPEKVERLSSEFLEFPVRVEIAPQSTPAVTIEQFAYKTPNIKTKINLLESLLNDAARFSKVIVFTKTRQNANNIFKFIQRKIDERSGIIHANKDQNSRINAINTFKSGELRILVSTDVTARGIDISQVSHVISFDVPVNYEDYIHRIGRTGRARNQGTAIIFINPPDEYNLREIEKLSRTPVKFLDLPPDVVVPPTEKWEKIEQDRELDRIKRKNDPDFKGAFHEKKRKNQKRRKKH
jgi:ATP-dependent RNA helicase RhlE